MDIKKYFKRIGLPEDLEISNTYEFLKSIHYSHVVSVPYENLDIINSKPLSLEFDDLYDKIVNHNRGGYCFEMNGFFSGILEKTGFETTDYLCRYLRNEPTLPMRGHRITAVKCEDKTYICDVGIGQAAPRYPLILQPGIVQEQFGEAYKYEINDSGEWELFDLHNGEWCAFYSFSPVRQHKVDFYQATYYFETNPQSKFNKTYIVSMKTPNGRKSISDRDFKIFEGEEMVSIEADMSDERRNEILKKEFGIELH